MFFQTVNSEFCELMELANEIMDSFLQLDMMDLDSANLSLSSVVLSGMSPHQRSGPSSARHSNRTVCRPPWFVKFRVHVIACHFKSICSCM